MSITDPTNEAQAKEISGYGKPKNYSTKASELSRLHTSPCEIQEKLDGSQMSWALDEEGNLLARSKGKMLSLTTPEHCFGGALVHLQKNIDKLRKGIVYRGECIRSQRHNHLTYGRAPKGNLVLFDAYDVHGDFWYSHASLTQLANDLGIDVTQSFGRLKANEVFTTEKFRNIYENNESILGGKIEGVVIKNYQEKDNDGKTLMAKWVADEFREVEGKPKRSAQEREAAPEGFIELAERYRTEARWRKGIQHLSEAGLLTNTPKDIGLLVKEIQRDIHDEEGQTILTEVAALGASDDQTAVMVKDLYKHSVDGFAQFYKKYLNDPV